MVPEIIFDLGEVFIRPNDGKIRAAADGAVMPNGMTFGVQFHSKSSGQHVK
jgi:hypothetical protein